MDPRDYQLWLHDESAGPFSLAQIRELKARGEIGWSTLWSTDGQNWLPLHDLTAFFASAVPTVGSPPVPSTPPPVPVTPRPPMSVGAKVAIGFGALVLLLLILGAILPDQGPSSYEVYSTATSDFVPNLLKSPAAAKFCGFSECHVSRDSEDNYLVTGWVDAQNSFGVPLRKRFACKMHYEGRQRGWTHLGTTFD